MEPNTLIYTFFTYLVDHTAHKIYNISSSKTIPLQFCSAQKNLSSSLLKK